MIAASLNDAHIMEMLLEHAGDVDSRDPKGRTPLMYAAIKGHNDLVDLLLDYDADVTLKDQKRRTAARYAKGNGHSRVSKPPRIR